MKLSREDRRSLVGVTVLLTVCVLGIWAYGEESVGALLEALSYVVMFALGYLYKVENS